MRLKILRLNWEEIVEMHVEMNGAAKTYKLGCVFKEELNRDMISKNLHSVNLNFPHNTAENRSPLNLLISASC